jgi:hypothetical protein
MSENDIFLSYAEGSRGNPEAVAVLLAKGADPNRVNKMFLTARQEAVMSAVDAYIVLETKGIEGLRERWPVVGTLTVKCIIPLLLYYRYFLLISPLLSTCCFTFSFFLLLL